MSTTAPHGDRPEAFRPWDGDHTALVHVLREARNKRLSLSADDDQEQLAEMILNSHWLAAREAHAATRAQEAYDDTGKDTA